MAGYPQWRVRLAGRIISERPSQARPTAECRGSGPIPTERLPERGTYRLFGFDPDLNPEACHGWLRPPRGQRICTTSQSRLALRSSPHLTAFVRYCRRDGTPSCCCSRASGSLVGRLAARTRQVRQIAGREHISIDATALHHRIEAFGIGRTKNYRLSEVKNPRDTEPSLNLFTNRSAWIPPVAGSGFGPAAFARFHPLVNLIVGAPQSRCHGGVDGDQEPRPRNRPCRNQPFRKSQVRSLSGAARQEAETSARVH